MSTELKNAVKAADAIPQYDMCVKRLLAAGVVTLLIAIAFAVILK